MLWVSAQKRSDRLRTCQECEHYVPKTKSCGDLVKEAFTDSPLCGCYMPAKTKLKTASCPLGKWEAVIKDADIQKIKSFLEKKDSLKRADELNALSKEYLKGQKASTCPSCNRSIINELKAIVNNATT